MAKKEQMKRDSASPASVGPEVPYSGSYIHREEVEALHERVAAREDTAEPCDWPKQLYVPCPKCQRSMSYLPPEGYAWRCSNKECKLYSRAEARTQSDSPRNCCGDAHMELEIAMSMIEALGFVKVTTGNETVWRNERAELAEQKLSEAQSETVPPDVNKEYDDWLITNEWRKGRDRAIQFAKRYAAVCYLADHTSRAARASTGTGEKP